MYSNLVFDILHYFIIEFFLIRIFLSVIRIRNLVLSLTNLIWRMKPWTNGKLNLKEAFHVYYERSRKLHISVVENTSERGIV
jgi:hypothetical protein